MFSKENYSIFSSKLLPIVEDTLEKEPDKDNFNPNSYFMKRGLWEGTEKQIYLYHKEKLPLHKKTLLSLCKSLPKFHQPSEKHGGTISAFDLLVDARKHPELTSDEKYYQIIMANHFSNLLEATQIAQPHPASYQNHKTFLIVINPKYREYMEKDGIEPFDD